MEPRRPPPAGDQPIGYSALPASLRARAHVTGSGELLWPREHADAILDWFLERSTAVTGGEAYGPRGQANFCFIHEWRTEPPWTAAEPWAEFVERGSGQARAVIEADGGPEQPETPAMYFFAVIEKGL